MSATQPKEKSAVRTLQLLFDVRLCPFCHLRINKTYYRHHMRTHVRHRVRNLLPSSKRSSLPKIEFKCEICDFRSFLHRTICYHYEQEHELICRFEADPDYEQFLNGTPYTLENPNWKPDGIEDKSEKPSEKQIDIEEPYDF